MSDGTEKSLASTSTELVSVPAETLRLVTAALERFHEAEADLKRAETALVSLNMAAVNELRYAGRHMLRAVQAMLAHDHETVVKEVQKCSNHSIRARYDCADGVLLEYLGAIGKFFDDYRGEHIPPDVIDVAKLSHAATEAQAQAGKTKPAPDEPHDFNREAICDRTWQIVESLTPWIVQLRGARNRLNAAMSSRKTRAISWGGIAVLAGLVIAACTWLFPQPTRDLRAMWPSSSRTTHASTRPDAGVRHLSNASGPRP